VSKAIIVVDFAYKSPKRMGRGTGRQGLKATLKYLQFRDKRNNHLAKAHTFERWQDRGMGLSHGEIFRNCDALQSKHVLAWTWVISPAPDLMELVPVSQRRELLYELTERVVEDYYTERGFDVPEYSFLMHSAKTKGKDGEPPQEHLHTHVIRRKGMTVCSVKSPVSTSRTCSTSATSTGDRCAKSRSQTLNATTGSTWTSFSHAEEAKCTSV
jgi:hypothetical protein